MLTTGKTFGLSARKWAALLALGLGFANLLIWLVAITRVLLPYDEAFVGMSRSQLEAISPYLLPFMAHDRIVMAGTVLSSAVIYLGLAVFGIRRRLHWATSIVRWSAGIGFLSFLLFLGFGYFDPVHAMLSAGVLPMFFLGIRGEQRVYAPDTAANLHSSRQWLLSQWGQLMFVVGMGLFLGGLSVVVVGLIGVFVPQDLDYLRTTATALATIHPRLLPLIAHDRVGFGGALVSNGLAVLLLSLWGFRQGAWWVWLTLVIGGLPGFVAGIGTHFSIGYVDFIHLAPAYIALVLYVCGWRSIIISVSGRLMRPRQAMERTPQRYIGVVPDPRPFC
jgi:hypothetical protein